MHLRRSAVLAALGAAPFISAFPASAQAAKVRIAYIASDGGIEPYYAQDQGFYTKAGLDVELQAFTNTPRMIEAITGGALDVGPIVDPITLSAAVLRGIPIGAFAGGLVYSSAAPTYVLCVAKNGPVRSAKDLEGQVLGTAILGGTPILAAQAWIEENGGDFSKIKLFETPFPELAPALQRGTIAAAMISEPFVTYAGDTIRVLSKPFDVFGKGPMLAMWFASRDWVARNLDTVRRLTGAIYETARWANTHRSDSLQILVKVAKLDPDRVRGMNRSTFGTSLDPRDVQTILDVAAKYKVLERPVEARELIVNLR